MYSAACWRWTCAPTLLHKREVGITLHKMRAQRMLQAVGMSLLGWQACLSRDCLEDAEELSAVKPSAVLRSEHKTAAVVCSLSEPSLDCKDLIQQRLPAMPVERLYRLQTSLEPSQRNRFVLYVQVAHLQPTDFALSPCRYASRTIAQSRVERVLAVRIANRISLGVKCSIALCKMQHYVQGYNFQSPFRVRHSAARRVEMAT
jgi:hypothetical protein